VEERVEVMEAGVRAAVRVAVAAAPDPVGRVVVRVEAARAAARAAAVTAVVARVEARAAGARAAAWVEARVEVRVEAVTVEAMAVAALVRGRSWLQSMQLQSQTRRRRTWNRCRHKRFGIHNLNPRWCPKWRKS
jgi:hypothetical protein